MEGGAAEKLPEEGGCRNLLNRDSLEITEETKQTVGLGILHKIVGHIAEKGLGIRLHDPDLEYQRGIECGIGILA